MNMMIDPALCVTHGTSSTKVNEYADLIDREAVFPPVRAILKDGAYYISDGAHRVAACRKLKIPVYTSVVDFEDADPFELSLVGSRFNKKP